MGKQKLLFLCRLIPEYNVATGDRYQTEMLEELSRDFEIHLAAVTFTDPAHCEYHRSRYAAGLYLGHLHSTIDTLRTTGRSFDIVMFGKSDVAYIFPLVKSAFPGAVTVVSTVDIQYRRERMVIDTARKYGIPAGDIPYFPTDPDATKRDELSFYRSADYLITVSREEKQLLAGEGIPGDRIFVCHISQPLVDNAYNPEGRYLTFVGYADHLPNYLSMKAFIDTVFPRLKNYLEKNSYRIAIVGGDRNSLYHGLERGSLVEVPGHLDIAEIRARYYVNTSLSLAPLVAGAGVKGKVLEAIGCRLPVVTTDVGLQGLEEFRDSVIRIDMDDPKGTAEKIISVLDNREKREELSEKAALKLIEYNSRDDTYRTLRIRLDTIARLREPDGGLLRALLPLRRIKWRIAG